MQTSVQKTVCLCITSFSLFAISIGAWAWYPSAPGYQDWPYYNGYGVTPGYSGRVTPRIFMHGKISRYGDYRVDMHVSGLNRYQMYQAWLWYNYLKYLRNYE